MGRAKISSPATRSCSPKWSTTATSFPGRCSPNAPARSSAYLPVTGDEGLLDLSKLDELLTREVKLFAFTHISNSLGTVNPVAELCERARKLGVTTLVDAAQSAGHRPLDVQEIGCDFLAFSGHKICGPTGIGVLWGREEILNAMPPYQGGGEMILSVDYFKTTYKPAPHRFEAGTPDISGAIGLHAALDYLDAIGRDNIFRHDQELAAYAYEELAQVEGHPVVRAQNRPRGAGELFAERRSRA